MITKISEQQYCEIVKAIADNYIVDTHDREYAVSYNSIYSVLSGLLKSKLGIEVEQYQVDDYDWNPTSEQVPIRYLGSIVVVKTTDLADDCLSSYTIAQISSVQPLEFKCNKGIVKNAKYWKLLYNFSV